MIKKIFTKIIGTSNERTLKRLSKNVEKINAFEASIKALSDEQLREKTYEFRKRIQDGATLDDILPEAFAVVREASIRTLKLRHFDVQLIGGMVLHEGKISEMRTGEGKTLVATLAAYLNALSQKGVHIVTVNDYLARRDAKWMGPIYEFLGLSVGVILNNQPQEEKREAYACDITYGTNNEFGFDYLRDNMVFSYEDKVQRGLNFAIVDEVDSILIDEARTPLIISGPTEDGSELYITINKLIPQLIRQTEKTSPGDYWVDEKNKQVFLSEDGQQHVEKLLDETGLLKNKESLYSASNIVYMHYLTAALKAHTLFHRDVEYIVKDGQVVIVDEHTGRTMEGRRWSDGLHQAVEAKENVQIRSENQTLASITFQNYFRLYKKLAGMTGTADTEAIEFSEIYGLEVVVIPTNMPMIRIDHPDQIYLTVKEKYNQIIEAIKDCHTRKQPVLVGTISIENSEYVSRLLAKEKIPHQVLNAKYHEREAAIIAQAGKPGAVTIATNMAGRGTDIVLGGNLEAELATLIAPSPEQIETIRKEWQERHDLVIKAGGLHILGTERHESRRIDNQLRGRSGRQGDTGSSRFYLSLEDNLMRIFASERVKLFMQRLGMKENEAIEHPFISKAIENAQRKVEGFNFDIRKQLLDYDNVANEQRKIVYEQRDELMLTDDISETVNVIREEVINNLIATYIPPQSLEEQWDIDGLEKNIQQDFNLELSIRNWLEQDEHLYDELLRKRIYDAFIDAYKTKEALLGASVLRLLEKTIMLQLLDAHWKEHLSAMDHLREGIHLRGYAQQDPKQAYKRESFKLFTEMLKNLKNAVLATLYTVQIKAEDEVKEVEERQRRLVEEQQKKMHYIHQQAAILQQQEQQGELAKDAAKRSAPAQAGPKVGRNDPCPCGSGKKFKQCCGKLD
jgi:preprotein translocase subunit SecA